MRELQSSRWANVDAEGHLRVNTSERLRKMVNSDGSGEPLLLLKQFGADVIRFPARGGVSSHTHDGDHILLVLAGQGRVMYDGQYHHLEPGVCYMVQGSVPHAIEAKTDLVMVAVGNKHFPVDSEERMGLVKVADVPGCVEA